MTVYRPTDQVAFWSHKPSRSKEPHNSVAYIFACLHGAELKAAQHPYVESIVVL